MARAGSIPENIVAGAIIASFLSCPGYLSGDSTLFPHRSSVMVDKVTEAAVVGGVDTHKDLHVAAVVPPWL